MTSSISHWPGGYSIWAAYPPGTRQELTLLKGAAGFHQLELAPIYERTRRFCRDRET